MLTFKDLQATKRKGSKWFTPNLWWLDLHRRRLCRSSWKDSVMRWQWKLRRTEKYGGWHPQNRRSPSVQPLGPHLAPSPKSNVETRWRQGFQQGPLLSQETKAQNEALAQLSRKLQSAEARQGLSMRKQEVWQTNSGGPTGRTSRQIQVAG